MYESDHSKIHHAEEHGVVVLHLKNAIGDDSALKSELLHLASHVQSTGAKKVMIVNDDLTHPVSPEVQKWAQMSVEYPMLAGGVDKIAVVHPNDSRMFALMHVGDSARKRYFSSEAEARAWLD